MLQEGKKLSEVENKADQIPYRIMLNKISTISKGNTLFSKLIELREIQKRWSSLHVQVKSSEFKQTTHMFIQN